MKQINSIFTNEIITQVYKSSSLEDGIKIMKDTINAHAINVPDKQKMLNELQSIPTLQRLQFYVTNLMLKYEGLGAGEFKTVQQKIKEKK